MNKQKIKILIVEDEPSVAKDIQNKLKRHGSIEAVIVDNGLDAINHAKQFFPDLVLMDIVLLGSLDGIQTAAAIQHNNNTPVIYLTAYSDQVFLDRAKITDPMAYILKPVTERDLHIAITFALNKAEIQRQQEENNFLNATLVSFSDALLVWDVKGVVTRINDALLKILAAKEHEVLGKNVVKVFDLKNLEDGQVVTEKLIYTVEKSGNLKEHYCLLVNSQNKISLPVRVSANRIFDSHHQSYGYVMQIRDDTERTKQEQALRESDSRFRQLSEHIESIFCLSDLQKRQVIYLSPAYEKIYGRPANISSLRTAPFLNHVYTADYDRVKRFINSLHEQTNCEETFRIIRPDGSLRWVKTRCYPIKDSSNIVYRMACVIDDVTEHKIAELKLQRAAKVFDNTAEGIMITDVDLNIIAVNRAFTNITGYAADEAIGKTTRLLKSGEHGPEFYQNLWRYINTTGHWQGEITNRRKNGETFPQWMTISTIYDDDGEIVNYVAVLSDISSIKKSKEKLDYLAHHDHLTGFVNRLLFNARLEHAIELAERDKHKVTVLLMDLDRFKDINDSLGHAVGDELLKLIAERLKACLRDEDTLGRLGGDEFIFIIEELGSQEKIIFIAQKIQNIFIQPFVLEKREIIVTASMGISIYPDNGIDAQTLIKHADLAMYKSKQHGKNNFSFYSEDLNVDHINRLTLSTQMRQGLDRKEFVVHYQPKLSLQTGKIMGMEALVRWQHPETGLISPSGFISLAEETGFIEELGSWVLNQACQQCNKWNQHENRSLVVAVNLSAREFMYSDIVSRVKRVVEKTGLNPRFLELEITESGLMERAETVTATLDALKSIGIGLSIDDFGTGYSSLSYLKRFPIDKLKIDRSFVKDLPDDDQDAAISRSIIALGKSLNLVILAEGVETEVQRDFMIREGCDEMQGFLFSEPVSAENFEVLLQKNDAVK